jgi:hypothetical protein
MQFQEQKELLLRTILLNRERWKYNREFAKIVEKMQRGKNLEKKEFSKIHWFIWDIGH